MTSLSTRLRRVWVAVLVLKVGFVLAGNHGLAKAPSDAPVLRLPAQAPSTTKSPAAVATAKKAYARAAKFFKKRRYARALESALRAYQAVPNASMALTAATIEGASGDHCAAFDRLLTARSLDPTIKELALIDAGLDEHGAACGPGYSVGIIRVTPSEAEVTIGGQRAPTEQLIGLRVGPHALRLSAPGHQPRGEVVTVRVGARMTLSFALNRVVVIERPVPPPPTVDPPPPTTLADPPLVTAASETPEGGAVWPVALTITGAVLVVAGIPLYLVGDERAQAANALSGPDTEASSVRRAKFEAAVDESRGLQASAWVSWGLGAAMLVAGTVGMFTATSATLEEPATNVGVAVFPHPSVTFGGHF